MKRLGLFAAAGTIALVLGVVVPARALIVFDPNNYVQNVLTAARELQQINNQITTLQNEAQMLINQARNLASLPYSSLQQLQSSIQRTQQLLAQAQRIAYDVQQIDRAFSTSYAPASGNQSNQLLISNAQARWQNSYAATCHDPGDPGRLESPTILLPLVDSRDHARQDRRHQAADQDSAAVVRQAKIDWGHSQGGHDERGVDATRYRRPQQGA